MTTKRRQSFIHMELDRWKVFSLLSPALRQKVRLACVFGTHGNEALLVTIDDEVYALGSNGHGCLGLGNQQGTLFPQCVEQLCGKGIQSFTYGSGPHVLALTERGEVYSWGQNVYCELGHGASTPGLLPTMISSFLSTLKVVEIACGSHHSIALTDCGQVFGWGENNCGQVGSGTTSNQCTPVRVTHSLSSRKVVNVACGQVSTHALLDNGEVYSWGYNGNGQLGLGNSVVNQLVPAFVQSLVGVVITKVMCGLVHCLALTDEGELYGWGANSMGQLGTGHKTNSVTPIKVATNIGRVVDIAAHHYNNMSAARTQHKVYMWGQCQGLTITSPVETPFTSLHEVFACFADTEVTYKPIQLEKKSSQSVADSLRLAFDDQNTSDLTILVNGKNIHVHKSILKIRCEYFRNMFKDHWSEDKKSVLELKQFSYPVIKAFLQYLYTDELVIASECALELLDLANAYCEQQLKELCEQILKHGVNVENVATLYSTAITHQSEDLRKFCFNFILNHMTAVSQTVAFSSLDENTFRELIVKAGEAGVFKT
ncbi:RCC1 and BTB domain-containing protein 1 isoform X1 [Frankliniella occidentalis]|uniref:RCC1 and BTB domain-containing protein 1 isoform X1 n=2 Tax=Frankliniella occidentalis TaxID=133901 RepID=A0A6J1SDX7_FRAOC|nr:RCC1 and BTB domain-containing protein 1 isoform X1 [Frankliniella occidentalis]